MQINSLSLPRSQESSLGSCKYEMSRHAITGYDACQIKAKYIQKAVFINKRQLNDDFFSLFNSYVSVVIRGLCLEVTNFLRLY